MLSTPKASLLACLLSTTLFTSPGLTTPGAQVHTDLDKCDWANWNGTINRKPPPWGVVAFPDAKCTCTPSVTRRIGVYGGCQPISGKGINLFPKSVCTYIAWSDIQCNGTQTELHKGKGHCSDVEFRSLTINCPDWPTEEL